MAPRNKKQRRSKDSLNLRLLEKEARQLFPDDDERTRFVTAVVAGETGDTALIWLSSEASPFASLPREPWMPDWLQLLQSGQEAGKHELHARGAYYCLDSSSAFAAAVSCSGIDRDPEVLLDICAAPGGKSVYGWRTLAPRFLVSNEVSGKRLPALISNFARCSIRPAVVLKHDPSRLGEYLSSSADTVIVDAPCSGQSLPARGIGNPGCFHPATINMNANRQRRILACAAGAVAPGGFLAYSTCTYSRKENEGVFEWFLGEFPQFEPVRLPAFEAFQSQYTSQPCYRRWPHLHSGAGGFACLMRNTAHGERQRACLELANRVWSSEQGDGGAHTPTGDAR